MSSVVQSLLTSALLLSSRALAQGTTTGAPAPYASPKGFAKDITDWLAASNTSQASLSKTKLFANINVANAAPGTVIAAQSYAEPDYAYNWVRDSSLTMDVVVSLYKATNNSASRSSYETLLFQYASARAAEQTATNLQTGLGEPKFYLNNSVFTGPWGRPQNDGPATAAITLMEFADAYLAGGGTLDNVKQKLYDSTAHPTAPIQRDLLFVASNWSSPSFDLWEEEEGDHFYNRIVQRKALLLGSSFASRMGDSNTASTLKTAADSVSGTMDAFWDSKNNFIKYESGEVLYNKTSFKDSAVILGVIHGYAGDGVYGYTDEKVLASALAIATSFLPVYGVANTTKDASGAPLGIPVGRYPEDVYDGVGQSLGNPWYLTTAVVAELFYRAVHEYQNSTSGVVITNTSLPFWNYFAAGTSLSAGQTVQKSSQQFNDLLDALRGWGDAFIRRVKFHTPADGSLAEEYNRNNGTAQGAKHLTWSYASIITAAIARAEANGDTAFLPTIAGSSAATGNSTSSGKTGGGSKSSAIAIGAPVASTLALLIALVWAFSEL